MAAGKPRRWKRSLILASVGLGVAGGLVVIGLLAYLGLVTRTIDRRMSQIKSAKATEFYALYPPFRPGQRLSATELKTLLLDQGYVENNSGGPLSPREFSWSNAAESITIRLFRPPFRGTGRNLERLHARLVFTKAESDFSLTEIADEDSGSPLETFENLPQRLGAYYAGRARTQDIVPLSDIPATARLAVIAIEDVHFLEHPGVSIRSILRALFRDLRQLKMAEGGSTLTQQLMKNLYFTREKSISRKVKEAIYALVTESRYSKEDILEGYLNEVYLGQAGTREIHGFAEGAQYYFNRPITQLSLHQSALLAAIVQGPAVIHPHRYPEKAMLRRNLVLRQMREADFISPEEFESSVKEPLGVVPKERTLSDVDYALELVTQQIPEAIRTRMDTEPYTIYASLNPYLQALAARTLKENLARISDNSPAVKALEKKKIYLQSALIAVDLKECSVLALQGGKSYRETQFNRVLHGKRQPGSLFKPFVFLAGLMSNLDPPITPLTELDDSPMEWKYDKQVWSPKNYDNKFRGKVTVRKALELSLNVPTARLAELVGVKNLQQTIVSAGFTSPIPRVPSISLGAADVTPLELAQAYTTFGTLGETCQLRPYFEVFDESGNRADQRELTRTRAFPPAPVFQVVNMMKGVFTHGSARSARSSGIDLERFAGKTGTTNEARDAWFVGFSSNILVLVWVGYDEKEKLGIPGSAAALPLWVDFVKKARLFTGSDDFTVPDDLVPAAIDRGEGLTAPCTDVSVDYFVPGTVPVTSCPLPADAS